MRRHEPAFDDLAVTPFDQRPVLPRQFLHDRVVLGTLVPRDVDDVAEAFVGQHTRARTLVLQHGIRCRGGAMQHVIDIARFDAVVAADFGDPLNDGAGGIVGRSRDFMDGDLAGVQIAIDDIGERAADIDADGLHDAPVCVLPLVAIT